MGICISFQKSMQGYWICFWDEVFGQEGTVVNRRALGLLQKNMSSELLLEHS